MLQHLLKIIWHQRWQNGWIIAELFLVFVLLWYILDYFITFGYTASIDYSCDIRDTYQVRLATLPETSPQYLRPEDREPGATVADYRSLIDRIRQYPSVRHLSLSEMSAPYSPSYRNTSMGQDSASSRAAPYRCSWSNLLISTCFASARSPAAHLPSSKKLLRHTL